MAISSDTRLSPVQSVDSPANRTPGPSVRDQLAERDAKREALAALQGRSASGDALSDFVANVRERVSADEPDGTINIRA